jgi:hypothetical protein
MFHAEHETWLCKHAGVKTKTEDEESVALVSVAGPHANST